MGILVELSLTFVIILCVPLVINGQGTCEKNGPCSCVFPNGTGIDLSPASKSDFFTTQIYSEKKIGKQYELVTYYYHPCYDAKPPINKMGPNDSCNTNLSMCRLVYTLDLNDTTNMFTMDSGVTNCLGSTNESSFSSNGDSIIYKNLPSNNIVLLVCANVDDKLHVNSLQDPNQIVLAFYSRSACLKDMPVPDKNGRSLGSTLLIIFFSLVIFYIVLGVGTKKFLMGATGIEVIPNLAFWSDLPNLIKDGWAFMLNGFKLPVRGTGPAMAPSPNSYDSI